MIRKLSLSFVALSMAAIGWLHMQDYKPLVRAAVARVATNANSNIAVAPIKQIDVPISAGRISRIGDAHTDTLDLADISQQAQVKHLVITHVIPALPDVLPARRAFMSGMHERYDGPITLAYDGMRIPLNLDDRYAAC